jgi:hypothetical protein
MALHRGGPLLADRKPRLAKPRCTLHAGGLNIECEARLVGSAEERARVLGEIVPTLSWAGSLQSWLEGSPLAEILPVGGP